MAKKVVYEGYGNDVFTGLGIYNATPYEMSKEKLVSQFMSTMLTRTQAMFKHNGLPDTIPKRILEGQIQRGYTIVIEVKKGESGAASGVESGLYQTWGALGGALDYNYMPKTVIVSNPYLIQKEYTVGKDCVVIPNDSRYMGLYEICRYYATLLAENVISKNILTINSRAMNIFKVGDEKQKQDVEDFIKSLKNGDISAIVNKGGIYKVIDTIPFGDTHSHQPLTDLIEDQQYIKASLFNELGLQANYNMKRESINSNEAQLNESALRPFVDDMLEQRQIGDDKVNKMFGVHWSTEFNSSWKTQEQAEQLSLELEKASIHMDKNSEEDNGGKDNDSGNNEDK